MKLLLLSLTLTNFKGCRNLTVEPNGQDLEVWGDNETGKTTIADAVYWLLFGKDSQNAANFGIKTVDPETEKPISGLEHEVEGTFALPSGERLTLKRSFHEVFTKKRGEAESSKDGHTTDYKVNGVPVKEGEYLLQVKSVCPDEKLFRLLTDRDYFNRVLTWQERRTMVLEACGDVTDAEVVSSNPALEPLPAILGNRKIDDHRKVVNARCKEINSELDRLPVRIDEANRSLQSIEAGVKAEAEDPEKVRAELQQLREDRAKAAADNGVAELSVQVRTIDAEILQVKNQAAAARDGALAEIRAKFNAKQTELDNAIAQCQRIHNAMALDQEAIDKIMPRRQVLLDEYAAEEARAFEFSGETVCPSCGQDLPEERVQAVRAKAEEDFNLAKARKLETILSEGKALKAKREEHEATLASKESELEALIPHTDELRAELEQFREELDLATKGFVSDKSTVAKVAELEAQKQAVEDEIERRKEGSVAGLEEWSKKILDAEARLQAADAAFLARRQAEATAKRTEELKGQQKSLSAEFSKLERELFLCDEFVRTKVRLLEERINARFKIARFRLFKEQENGGLKECCDVTVRGNAYHDLNNAMKINVGLDVINTLAEHHKFAPFVIVDNAESVTRPLPTIGQQIRLVVSEPDKALRFVTVPADSKKSA